MPSSLSIESIDLVRDTACSVILELSRSLPHCRYVDFRVEVSERRGARAENGKALDRYTDAIFSFGVRVIAGERIRSSGHWGQTLGVRDIASFDKHLREGAARAYARATANARQKIPMNRIVRVLILFPPA